MSTQDEINRLDGIYQKLTGRAFRASGLLTGREYSWYQFLAAGYTAKDLEAVLLWIKRGILDGKRHRAALGFRRLVSDLGVFEDELGTCMAELRNAKPHVEPKQRVLDQARPTAQPERPAIVSGDSCKRVDYWIEQLRKAAE